jgi:hypothetical protein
MKRTPKKETRVTVLMPPATKRKVAIVASYLDISYPEAIDLMATQKLQELNIKA